MSQRFRIDEQHAGERVDRVLAEELGLSRARVKSLFEAGSVRIDGRKASKGDQVVLGSVVELEQDVLPSIKALPDPSILLSLIYEDAHVVVVAKPRGVPSHPLRAGELGCVANCLLAWYPEMEQIGYDERQPGLVNRIDTDTSGLLLAARTERAFNAFRALTAADKIHKSYFALVEHVPTVPQIIDSGLAPSPKNRRKVEVCSSGFTMSTELKATQARGRFHLVEAHVTRAYRHQIRVHLAHVGSPIVGDALYGGLMLEGLSGHFLHAAGLSFEHPVTQEWLHLKSPLPDDFPA